MNRMKKNPLTTILALVATAAISALFVSCDNDEGITGNDTTDKTVTPLSFDVSIKDNQASRASLITKWTDAIASQGLGVTLYNGTTASSGMYPTCKGTSVYTTTDNIWKSDTPLGLRQENAYVTAYYPASMFKSLPNAVPNRLFVANTDTDLLYAPLGQATANSKNPHVSLSMYHAFVCLKLSVKRQEYSGTGQLQKISCQSESIGTSGLFDSTTGEFSNVTDGAVTVNLGSTKLAELQMNSYTRFVIAKESTAFPINFSVTIDDKQYTCRINQKLRPGYINEFVLIFSDEGIKVTEVTTLPWSVPETNTSNAIISDWTTE